VIAGYLLDHPQMPPERMIQTIEALRKLGVSSAEVRRCLIDAGVLSDARVRERALDSLLSVEPRAPRDTALLQTALSDEDQGVRRIAVVHLRNVGEAQTMDALALALRDADSWIRNQALLAIQEIGRGKGATDAFSEVFSSSGLLAGR
jgi:HEAT repeat protein